MFVLKCGVGALEKALFGLKTLFGDYKCSTFTIEKHERKLFVCNDSGMARFPLFAADVRNLDEKVKFEMDRVLGLCHSAYWLPQGHAGVGEACDHIVIIKYNADFAQFFAYGELRDAGVKSTIPVEKK